MVRMIKDYCCESSVMDDFNFYEKKQEELMESKNYHLKMNMGENMGNNNFNNYGNYPNNTNTYNIHMNMQNTNNMQLNTNFMPPNNNHVQMPKINIIQNPNNNINYNNIPQNMNMRILNNSDLQNQEPSQNFDFKDKDQEN